MAFVSTTWTHRDQRYVLRLRHAAAAPPAAFILVPHRLIRYLRRYLCVYSTPYTTPTAVGGRRQERFGASRSPIDKRAQPQQKHQHARRSASGALNSRWCHMIAAHTFRCYRNRDNPIEALFATIGVGRFCCCIPRCFVRHTQAVPPRFVGSKYVRRGRLHVHSTTGTFPPVFLRYSQVHPVKIHCVTPFPPC